MVASAIPYPNRGRRVASRLANAQALIQHAIGEVRAASAEVTSETFDRSPKLALSAIYEHLRDAITGIEAYGAPPVPAERPCPTPGCPYIAGHTSDDCIPGYLDRVRARFAAEDAAAIASTEGEVIP